MLDFDKINYNIDCFKNIMKLEDGTELVSKEFLTWLDNNGFFAKPASVKYHGNYTGGLFDHCLAVTEKLVNITKELDLKWQNKRSPYIVGMFHDLCKIEDYIIDTKSSDSETTKWAYNKEKILNGHGDKSIMILSQFMQLTEEEMFCIRFHMGAYETEGWDYYDRAIRKYETVLWTHTADMWASKVLDK